MTDFSTRLDTLPNVKKAHWYGFKRLGIETVRDLFYHFPNRYEDYATLVPIDALETDTKATVEGVVTEVKSERSWKKKMLITRASIEDTTGSLRVIWFNQRFVEGVVKVGERVRLSGKVSQDKEGLIMQSPAFERAERTATHTGRLVPVYPETTGLTSKFLRWQLATIFQSLKTIPDPLPADILTELHLPDLYTALAYMHFPKAEKQVLLAEKRFAFEEMLFLQLKSLSIKHAMATGRAISIKDQPSKIKDFIETLPFKLTKGQEKAFAEIMTDLGQTHPMNRLLNGDVGSGKTIVAALAMLSVSQAGYQSALLAPTEVLAEQHGRTFLKLFGDHSKNIALLTGSQSQLNGETIKKPSLLKAIAAGIPDIVIGTHALLEEKVKFHNLALIVVDEQHRFGVAQRASLQSATLTYADSTPTHAEIPKDSLLHREITYAIRGAVFAIKKELGLGHKEVIYQKAFATELKKAGLPFSQEATINITYDGEKVGTYRPDFIIDNKVIVEFKALPTIGKFEKQQVWHYLKGSDYDLALLVNFGHEDIQIERFAHSGQHRSASSQHESAFMPHYLSMTATPIPRTLALSLFGNLDLSLLDEVPAHKKPIITRVAASDEARHKVYTFIRKEIAKGRQAFVILPLVEESKAMEEVRAATTEHTRLQHEIFPDLRIGLLHGRQKSKEKDAIMQDFKNKKIDILVSTAVVEVGIDIPNATVMLIEGAERFGLSQLHQFRGRVGRGADQSYCFLFPSDGKSPESARLQALEKHTSGFDLAEIDLKLRGPGAFLGTRQSGLPDIAMEHLANARLIAIAREKAEVILKADPELKSHSLLQKTLQKFEEQIHLE